ncbi:MAG: lipase maturation factor family protein [Planctomycetes bacterium]|nr:lipase maturation factor family protein [Planctomycetota bacterium]
MSPPERPVLLYDGLCGFCRRRVARWRARTGDRIDYSPYQEAAHRAPGVPPERLAASVHLIDSDGSVTTGAEASFRVLAHAPGSFPYLAAYRRVPGFARAAEAVYGWIARHRLAITTLERGFCGAAEVPPATTLTRWLFFRLLAVVYLSAFLSLGVQVTGLVGDRGILPARELLAQVERWRPEEARHLLPTVCWWIGAGDAELRLLCSTGALLASLLLVGMAPIPVLLLLWICYLSLTTVGNIFLVFQWDALLLETGLVALLYAPYAGLDRPGRTPPPSFAATLLLRWLLFRLMFASGMVKLTSGDPTWAFDNLTALTCHYQTQPLPTWTSWYAHHLSPGFHRFSAMAMFVIEIGFPFGIFGPRRLRLVACAGLVFLQLLILASGNYGFFNLLALTLCVPLLDDGVLTAWLPRRLRERLAGLGREAVARGAWWRAAPLVPVALLSAALSGLCLRQQFPDKGQAEWTPPAVLRPLVGLLEWARPYRSLNEYGLFRTMTTRRPELSIEGSHDQLDWRPYTFRYKPGDVKRAPAFVPLYLPRLDWQMWFAALGGARQAGWLRALAGRLFERSPEVLALLEADPFPEGPPRFLRIDVYDYRFTTPEERKETGAWWRRDWAESYCPVMQRRR